MGLQHKDTIISVYIAENKYLCTVKHTVTPLTGRTLSVPPDRGIFFDTFFSKKASAGLPYSLSVSSVSKVSWFFTFTGKERDEETGYGYFGARYMDHGLMTMWLSVDPMTDKYPGISPYAYCVWNPVGAVDPDGEKPRLPRWLRIMTSKHVYRAIDYKIRHGGNLDVWETSSGCIFASVQSRNANVDDKGAVMIEAKMFRPEGYSSEAQIKATTDFFVNAESWMDEPATSVVDFGLKTAAEIGYSMVNDPAILLTGYSLAGTEATSSEKGEAFVGVAAGSLGRPLSKGMGTIKTAGKTGLAKYNDFVRKMGNYQGRTKKEMGRLYQNNKELNSAVSTYENFEKGISGTSVFRKEE